MPNQCTCCVCGKVVVRVPSRVTDHPFCSIRCRVTGPVPATPILSDDGLTASLPLFAGDNVTIVGYALIDAADAAWASQWKWRLSPSKGPGDGGYVIRSERPPGEQKRVYRLHRELLGLVHGDGLEGDHLNFDRLDNRRSNLRTVTHAGNMQHAKSRPGTSQYRGVSWKAKLQKWQAAARIYGSTQYLGVFDSEEEAARVASDARRLHMPYTIE